MGGPIAKLLKNKGADVSVIHSKTKNPAIITKKADIIISAVGLPGLIKKNWVIIVRSPFQL